ncbi:MAG: GNAT family N-acetyltransferase [Candidatus Omnitrophica bacterium]|nr:GNAT family N-acetyltransferase [Candidatus Omnitrophota bacterium]
MLFNIRKHILFKSFSVLLVLLFILHTSGWAEQNTPVVGDNTLQVQNFFQVLDPASLIESEIVYLMESTKGRFNELNSRFYPRVAGTPLYIGFDGKEFIDGRWVIPCAVSSEKSSVLYEAVVSNDGKVTMEPFKGRTTIKGLGKSFTEIKGIPGEDPDEPQAVDRDGTSEGEDADEGSLRGDDAENDGNIPRIGKKAKVTHISSERSSHEFTVKYGLFESTIEPRLLREDVNDYLKEAFEGYTTGNPEHDALLGDILGMRFKHPVQQYTYDELIEDILGLCNYKHQGENWIAVHKFLADDPIPVFHELLELYSKGSSLDLRLHINWATKMALKYGLYKYFKKLTWLFKGRLVVELWLCGQNSKKRIRATSIPVRGEVLSIAVKNYTPKRGCHYIYHDGIRALSRILFKERDRALTDKIKYIQTVTPGGIEDTSLDMINAPEGPVSKRAKKILEKFVKYPHQSVLYGIVSEMENRGLLTDPMQRKMSGLLRLIIKRSKCSRNALRALHAAVKAGVLKKEGITYLRRLFGRIIKRTESEQLELFHALYSGWAGMDGRKNGPEMSVLDPLLLEYGQHFGRNNERIKKSFLGMIVGWALIPAVFAFRYIISLKALRTIYRKIYFGIASDEPLEDISGLEYLFEEYILPYGGMVIVVSVLLFMLSQLVISIIDGIDPKGLELATHNSKNKRDSSDVINFSVLKGAFLLWMAIVAKFCSGFVTPVSQRGKVTPFFIELNSIGSYGFVPAIIIAAGAAVFFTVKYFVESRRAKDLGSCGYDLMFHLHQKGLMTGKNSRVIRSLILDLRNYELVYSYGIEDVVRAYTALIDNGAVDDGNLKEYAGLLRYMWDGKKDPVSIFSQNSDDDRNALLVFRTIRRMALYDKFNKKKLLGKINKLIDEMKRVERSWNTANFIKTLENFIEMGVIDEENYEDYLNILVQLSGDEDCSEFIQFLETVVSYSVEQNADLSKLLSLKDMPVECIKTSLITLAKIIDSDTLGKGDFKRVLDFMIKIRDEQELDGRLEEIYERLGRFFWMVKKCAPKPSIIDYGHYWRNMGFLQKAVFENTELAPEMLEFLAGIAHLDNVPERMVPLEGRELEVFVNGSLKMTEDQRKGFLERYTEEGMPHSRVKEDYFRAIDKIYTDILAPFISELKDMPREEKRSYIGQLSKALVHYFNNNGTDGKNTIEEDIEQIRSLFGIVHLNLAVCLKSLGACRLRVKDFEELRKVLPYNNALTRIIRMLGESTNIIGGYVDVTEYVIEEGQFEEFKKTIVYMAEKTKRNTPANIEGMLCALRGYMRKDRLAKWNSSDWDSFRSDIEGYLQLGFSSITYNMFTYYRNNKDDDEAMERFKKSVKKALPADSLWGGFKGFSEESKTEFGFGVSDELAILSRYIPIVNYSARDYAGTYEKVKSALQGKDGYYDELDEEMRTMFEFEYSRSADVLYEGDQKLKKELFESLRRIMSEEKPLNEVDHNSSLHFFLPFLIREIDGDVDINYLSRVPEKLSIQREYLRSLVTLLTEDFEDGKEAIMQKVKKGIDSLDDSGRKAMVDRFVTVRLGSVRKKKKIFRTQAAFVPAVKEGDISGIAELINNIWFSKITSKDLKPGVLRKWFSKGIDRFSGKLAKDSGVSRKKVEEMMREAFEAALVLLREKPPLSDQERREELLFSSIARNLEKEVDELVIKADKVLSGFKLLESLARNCYYVGLFDDAMHMMEFMMTGVCTWGSRPWQIKDNPPHFSVLALKDGTGKLLGTSQVQVVKTPVRGFKDRTSKRGYNALVLTGINLYQRDLPMSEVKAVMSLIEAAYVLAEDAGVVPVIAAKDSIYTNQSKVKQIIRSLIHKGLLKKRKLAEKVTLSNGSYAYNYQMVYQIDLSREEYFLKKTSLEKILNAEIKEEEEPKRSMMIASNLFELTYGHSRNKEEAVALGAEIERILGSFPDRIMEDARLAVSMKGLSPEIVMDTSVNESRVEVSPQRARMIIGKDVLFEKGRIDSIILSERLSEMIAAFILDDYQDLSEARYEDENAFFKLEITKTLINHSNYLALYHRLLHRYKPESGNRWVEKTNEEKRDLARSYQRDIDKATSGMKGIYQWNVFLSVMQDADPMFLVLNYISMISLDPYLGQTAMPEIISRIKRVNVEEMTSIARLRNLMASCYVFGDEADEVTRAVRTTFANFPVSEGLKLLKNGLMSTTSEQNFYRAMEALLSGVLPLSRKQVSQEVQQMLEDDLFGKEDRPRAISSAVEEILVKRIGSGGLNAFVEEMLGTRGDKKIPYISVLQEFLDRGANADDYGFLRDAGVGDVILPDGDMEAPSPVENDPIRELFITGLEPETQDEPQEQVEAEGQEPEQSEDVAGEETDYAITAAEKKDIKGIRRLLENMDEKDFLPSPDVLPKRVSGYDEGDRFLVAKTGDRIEGYIYASLETDEQGAEGESVLDIIEIAVAPRSRERGIGRALFEEVFLDAWGKGVRNFSVSAMHPAVEKIAGSFGFEKRGNEYYMGSKKKKKAESFAESDKPGKEAKEKQSASTGADGQPVPDGQVVIRDFKPQKLRDMNDPESLAMTFVDLVLSRLHSDGTEKIVLAFEDNVSRGNNGVPMSLCRELEELKKEPKFEKLLKNLVIIKGSMRTIGRETERYLDEERNSVFIFASNEARSEEEESIAERMKSRAKMVLIDQKALSFDSYYPLMEIVTISLAYELSPDLLKALKDDIDLDSVNIGSISMEEQRCFLKFVLLPKAEKLDKQLLMEKTRALRMALRSA